MRWAFNMVWFICANLSFYENDEPTRRGGNWIHDLRWSLRSPGVAWVGVGRRRATSWMRPPGKSGGWQEGGRRRGGFLPGRPHSRSPSSAQGRLRWHSSPWWMGPPTRNCSATTRLSGIVHYQEAAPGPQHVHQRYPMMVTNGPGHLTKFQGIGTPWISEETKNLRERRTGRDAGFTRTTVCPREEETTAASQRPFFWYEEISKDKDASLSPFMAIVVFVRFKSKIKRCPIFKTILFYINLMYDRFIPPSLSPLRLQKTPQIFKR